MPDPPQVPKLKPEPLAGLAFWRALAWGGLPLVVLLGTLLILWPLVSEWQRDSENEPSELAVGQTRTVRTPRVGCPRRMDFQALERVADNLTTWHQTMTTLHCLYLPMRQKVVVQEVDGEWVRLNWPGQGEYWSNVMVVTAPCDTCKR